MFYKTKYFFYNNRTIFFHNIVLLHNIYTSIVIILYHLSKTSNKYWLKNQTLKIIFWCRLSYLVGRSLDQRNAQLASGYLGAVGQVHHPHCSLLIKGKNGLEVCSVNITLCFVVLLFQNIECTGPLYIIGSQSHWQELREIDNYISICRRWKSIKFMI